jgi:hypothetical protein
VYAAALRASQHGSPRRRGGGTSASRAPSQRPRDPIAANRRNTCELGISSMSENSCTTRDARLDSVFDEAPKARRGVAERAFRHQKKFCVHLRGGLVGGVSGAREGADSRESAPSDSQTRALGSILQELDEAPRRSSSRRFPPARGRSNAATDTAVRRDRLAKERSFWVRDRASP